MVGVLDNSADMAVPLADTTNRISNESWKEELFIPFQNMNQHSSFLMIVFVLK